MAKANNQTIGEDKSLRWLYWFCKIQVYEKRINIGNGFDFFQFMSASG